MPISGPLHNDLEIGIKVKHYHPDPRFMALTYKSGFWRRDSPDSVFLENDEAELGVVHFESKNWPIKDVNFKFDPPVWKRRKCRRQMPTFPDALDDAVRITSTLEEIYLGRKILCGKCPHKQMPLESLPRLPDNSVICNGHGLRADLNSMEIIKRYA